MTTETSSYDDFAIIYNRHWGPRYAAAALDTLDLLLLPRIPDGAKILDLCCGSGQISRRLADRGFDVTGIDASAALISLAKNNAPNSSFEVADARHFSLRNGFQAAISLNDSLNHLLRIEDLQSAFLNVSNCMLSGGIFLFDLNLAHKYQTSWARSMSIIEEDAVCAAAASSDMQQKLAKFNAAVFLKARGSWTRKDVQLFQTWYTPETVTISLHNVGFVDVRVTDRKGDHLPDWSVNRAYFSCSKA